MNVSLKSFKTEQNKYIQELENVEQQVKTYSEQAKLREVAFSDNLDVLVARVNAVPGQVKKDNVSAQEELKVEIDNVLVKRNAQFKQEQEKYISALEDTTEKMSSCEGEIVTKYQDFINTLENTNLSNLYEQNQKLQSALEKRTVLLMTLSGVTLILSVVGLFL